MLLGSRFREAQNYSFFVFIVHTMDPIDMPAIKFLNVAIRFTPKDSLITALKLKRYVVSEHFQRLIVDFNGFGHHIPEEELAVWWCCQGSPVNESISKIQVVNELSLSVNLFTCEQSLQKLISKRFLICVYCLEHDANDCCLEQVLCILILVQVNNMQLKGEMFSIIGVLRSHSVDICMVNSRVEVELYCFESHTWSIIIPETGSRGSERAGLLIFELKHDCMLIDPDGIAVSQLSVTIVERIISLYPCNLAMPSTSTKFWFLNIDGTLMYHIRIGFFHAFLIWVHMQ